MNKNHQNIGNLKISKTTIKELKKGDTIVIYDINKEPQFYTISKIQINGVTIKPTQNQEQLVYYGITLQPKDSINVGVLTMPENGYLKKVV